MAVNRKRPKVGYGLQNALQEIPPLPIIAQRNPTVGDRAELGTVWINEAALESYILAAYVSGDSQWLNMSGGAGTFTSVTIDPGDLTVTQGNVILDAGDVIVTAGDITLTAGDISANDGTFDSLTINNGMTVTGPATFPNLADGVVQSDNAGLLFSDNGNDGEVLIGNTAGAPAWASITSPNATITITGGPNSIEIDTAAAAGITAVITDAGTAFPAANVIQVVGDGVNVNTSAATNVVTINLDDDVTLVGGLTAGTSVTATAGNITSDAGDIIATAGDIQATAGNIILPATAADGSEGVFNIGAVTMHTRGTNNLFIGENAGNFTFTIGTTTDNLAIGQNSMAAIAGNDIANLAIGNNTITGPVSAACNNNIAIGHGALEEVDTLRNTAIGTNALNLLSNGNANIAIGYEAGLNLLSGGSNVIIGNSSGTAYVANESGNLIVGNNITGVASEDNTTRIGSTQTTCFIAGIYGVTTASATTDPVIISDGNQLGTIASSMRFKENIEDMNEVSNPLLSLRPVNFEYKERPGIKTWGLIAEEVHEVMPSLVNLDKEGIPFSVKYHEMPALILNEMQKLQARINEIESNCTCRN